MQFKTKVRLTGLSLFFLLFLSIFYLISPVHALEVAWFDESEFPRIQSTLKIDSNDRLLPKQIEIQEEDQKNHHPFVLMPPAEKPHSIHLTVMLDVNQATQVHKNLIQNNLVTFLEDLSKTSVDISLDFMSLDSSVNEANLNLEDFIQKFDQIEFSQNNALKSFDNIKKYAEDHVNNSQAQDILLLINSTPFQDNRPDGVSGMNQQNTIKALSGAYDLIFTMGSPLIQIHSIKVDQPIAELVDLSHQLPGGFLGGFGVDLTSLTPLLMHQSPEHHVLQYYSHLSPNDYVGSEARWYVNGVLSHVQTYQNHPTSSLKINHLPENEWIANQPSSLEVEVETGDKMINQLMLYYKNEKNAFESTPFKNERFKNKSEGKSHYTLKAPSLMSKNYFSYYFSAQTPYSYSGSETGMISLPVVFYEDGIILEAQKIDEDTVHWSWHGPTVEKGKKFEVWTGKTLLKTTENTFYDFPIGECDLYQILQVKVVFSEDEKSYPSRPHEFYAGADPSSSLTEDQGVKLLNECLRPEYGFESPRINSPSAPLLLDRAGDYFLSMTIPQLIQSIEPGGSQFELIIYIARYLTKAQYKQYNSGAQPLPKAMLYKWVTLANHEEGLENTFDLAINELANRLRGGQSF